MSRSLVCLALSAAVLFGFLAVDTQGCSAYYFYGGEEVVCVEFDINMYACNATVITISHNISQNANKTPSRAAESYCYLSASDENIKIGHGMHTCSCPGHSSDEIIKKCKRDLLDFAWKKIKKGRCPDLEQVLLNMTQELATEIRETTLITNTTSTTTVTTTTTTSSVRTWRSPATTSTITSPAITINFTVEAVTPSTDTRPPKTTRRSNTSVSSFGTTATTTMATTLARTVSTTPAYRNHSSVVVSRLDKEQIRAERKRLLYRTKLRLLIISVIMTTVLAIQFFLIGQLRRYLRKDHAERMNLRKFARRGETLAAQKLEYVTLEREQGDKSSATNADRWRFMNKIGPSDRPAKIVDDDVLDYYIWKPTESTSKEGSSKTLSKEYLNSKEDLSRKLSSRRYHKWKATESASKEGSSKISSKENLSSKDDISRKTSKSKDFGSAESV